jgi:D-cysteine desulfhydrase
MSGLNTIKKQPVLFKYFPDLKDKISWIDLGISVSPVHKLTHLGHNNLWIKRDDMLSPLYGGNKVRRLEFVLGEAVKKNKTRIVTMGGIGTNHGLATAIFCKQLGLSCTLLLFDQYITPYVKENLVLFHKYNAKMIYTKTMLNAGFHYYLIQRLKHPNALFLYAGGSSSLGTLGAVNGAFELKEQIDEGLLPMPKYIFCPSASNGTMAGLILGFLLAQIKTTIIGVRVGASRLGPLPLNTPGTVISLMKKTYSLLKKNSSSIPPLDFNLPTMINEYCGDGYGYPTNEGNKAVDIFKKLEDINLEPVYTGKTCAALLDFIKDPVYKDEPIIYWHTYNSVDISNEARSVDYHQLPHEFHHFFEDKTLPSLPALNFKPSV